MKKLLIILSVVLLAGKISLFSQIKSGDKEISFHFNGYKTASVNGLYPYSETSTLLTVNPDIDINYCITDNFFFGIGIDYFRSKEETDHSVYIDSFYQESISNIVAVSIIPYLKFGYNMQILNKLYLKNNIKINYGFNKLEGNSYYIGAEIFNISEYYDLSGSSGNVVTGDYKIDQNFHHFGITLYPQFQYFLNKSVSVNIIVGDLNYVKPDKGEGIWSFSFNPIFWKLGASLKF